MTTKVLMVDVDGVLIDGRPEDGLPWHTSLADDLGIDPIALHEHFFAQHWADIVVGRADMMGRLAPALARIAPYTDADTFVAYWLDRDARIVEPLLSELARVRASGTRVYLATNQEHVRAAHLMNTLGLATHVDGIFYSAQLGAKKPDAAFFSKVQEAVAVHPDEILLVDDSVSNVEAARAAGWRAVEWTRDSAPASLRKLCG